jgi:hypothetical protein
MFLEIAVVSFAALLLKSLELETLVAAYINVNVAILYLPSCLLR